MIYRFRIISDEEKDFIFEMLIDSNALFSEFNAFIQEQLEFDKKEMTSFFLTDSDWKKEVEITLFDMSDDDSDTEQFVMDKITLAELVNTLNQRLLYMFDMFNNRYLYIELIRINKIRAKTPKCVRLEGTPPPQFLDDFEQEFEKEFEKLLEENNLEEIIEEPFEDPYDFDDDLNLNDDYSEDYY